MRRQTVSRRLSVLAGVACLAAGRQMLRSPLTGTSSHATTRYFTSPPHGSSTHRVRSQSAPNSPCHAPVANAAARQRSALIPGRPDQRCSDIGCWMAESLNGLASVRRKGKIFCFYCTLVGHWGIDAPCTGYSAEWVDIIDSKGRFVAGGRDGLDPSRLDRLGLDAPLKAEASGHDVGPNAMKP